MNRLREHQKLAKIISSKRFIFLIGTFSVSLIGSLGVLAVISPVEITISKAEAVSVDRPIELILSHNIKEIDYNQIVILPKADGRWSLIKGAFGQMDKVVFDHKEPLTTNTRYQINLPPVRHINGQIINLDNIIFTTEKAPGLEDIGLAILKDNQTIAMDEPLMIRLTSQNRGLRRIDLRVSNDIKLSPKVTGDQAFEWIYDGYLPANGELSLEIYDSKNNESLLKKNVKVASQPEIKTPAKEYGFLPTDEAIIEFDKPIDRLTAKLEFSLEGFGEWRSDTIYAFKPKTINPGQTYSYTLNKGLRSKDGGIISETVSRNFSSLGAVMAYIVPVGDEVPQARQDIKINFNQAVNKESAEARVSISSGQIINKSWQGNTMIVAVKDLGLQQSVTITVASGIINSGFGLPSVQSFSGRFTTEVRSRRLDVPYMSQQKGTTCVPATLRMVLAYYGIQRDEMTLVYSMGYAPREMDRSSTPYQWDDPAEMYVGDVNGKNMYQVVGPDAEPAAKAARIAGRDAKAIRGATAEWMAEQVYNGNPVIMFGATRANAGFETWQTPSGKMTVMSKASHVAVVMGVKGEANNPIGFWVNDPVAGGTRYWSVDQVRTNIARDAYQQAVVVY